MNDESGSFGGRVFKKAKIQINSYTMGYLAIMILFLIMCLFGLVSGPGEWIRDDKRKIK